MAGNILNRDTLIPLGVALAAVGLTVSAIRGIDRTDYQTDKSVATLKVEVAALEQRVRRAEDRMDKADVRWEQIREDLAKIKERLGIVEAKAPKR